jgi:hypothetical protein
MLAVWSFWTKPLQIQHLTGWPTPLHQFMSWVLSVETARQHYPYTALYTDDEGAAMLIDGIGLRFDHVSTDLNVLHRYDPQWWAVGKIFTYFLQTKPFVHIDNDVYLWKPLPEWLTSAPVFAQNPEFFDFTGSWYYPQKFDLIHTLNGWLPEEIEWYSTAASRRAVCCGILGGNFIDFIHYYAERALDTLLHESNRPVWTLLGGDNILIEQYLLSACIDYHRHQKHSPFHDVDIRFLFSSPEEAFNPQFSTRAGYSHLIGGAKRSPYSLERLEHRVRTEYPDYYEKCRALSASYGLK